MRLGASPAACMSDPTIHYLPAAAGLDRALACPRGPFPELVTIQSAQRACRLTTPRFWPVLIAYRHL